MSSKASRSSFSVSSLASSLWASISLSLWQLSITNTTAARSKSSLELNGARKCGQQSLCVQYYIIMLAVPSLRGCIKPFGFFYHHKTNIWAGLRFPTTQQAKVRCFFFKIVMAPRGRSPLTLVILWLPEPPQGGWHRWFKVIRKGQINEGTLWALLQMFMVWIGLILIRWLILFVCPTFTD